MELENAVEGVEEVVQQPSHDVKAREQGWKPKEEWDGSPEDWIDAKEFNQRGEYMDRIKTQSSLIKKLEKKLDSHEMTIKELAEHHKKVAEIEYTKALNDLKALKIDALNVGDHEQVVKIDDKLQDLKATKPVAPKEAKEELHPDVVEWIDDNPWYNEDALLRGAAEGLVQDMIKKNPSLQGQVKEVLDRVTTKLKEEFPTKFGIKTKMKIVESSGTETGELKQSNSAPKYTARHLNSEQKEVAKRFVTAGAFKNMDEYAAELAKIGGLDAQSKGA